MVALMAVDCHSERTQQIQHRAKAALLEESRKRRLLEDSDSEDEAAPVPLQPAPRPNPTAILDETPKPKRKVEIWEQSIGSLGSRPPLSGLVVVKKAKANPDHSNGQPQAAPAPGKVTEFPELGAVSIVASR
ncbi:protein CWC16 [Saguinus oedipus]|uniref:Protein CWC16 n=1 Tax=Saguinus oedipus TaxID=9490 RepID=A0ABQ9TQY9_SAGOE|nr:protein CWC16 [Saguinus oedipus]